MKEVIYTFLILFSLLYAIDYCAAGELKGAGAGTCGSWIEDRRNGTYASALNWIMGFISSYNMYVYKGSDPNGIFGSADHRSIALWMDNYCLKNPLNSMSTGTLILVNQLKNRDLQR